MTTFARTGSALLALTMAVAVHATTVTSSVIGATALNVATATNAEAKKDRKINRALKHLDKAVQAERAGDYEKANRHYDKANKLMDKASNGVVAAPECNEPHVLC